MNAGFDAINIDHQMGENATGLIAHFLASTTALIVLAECSLRRPHALP